MNKPVLSVGPAANGMTPSGAPYTASVTGGSVASGKPGSLTTSVSESFGTISTSDPADGSPVLGEPDSLTTSAPELSGALSANAAAENATVCKTSIIAKQKESIALPMLRFRFKTLLSSIPETTEFFGDCRIIGSISLNRIDSFYWLDPTALCII
ncbi:hypothetical protein [Paenibacillus cellulositrophicus]|uniref:hypothetical protein n=1 Tax=Paenibacillus cellulositrophicus TaxID=562959 RepID=UPI001FCBFC1C|nr:hypothetical protein [Paenibacillus cellulositrophicus]